MRPTKAIINLDAIRQNYAMACRLAPGSKNMAVVKANAYGHGLKMVAQALEAKVPAFAVACMDEAIQLRDFGIIKPILVLQGPTQRDDVALAAAKNFCLMLHSRQQIARLLLAKPSRPVNVWLKLDTGMHRLGLTTKALDKYYPALSQSANTAPGMVLCTHFFSADETDNPAVQIQTDNLKASASKYKLPMSMANSAAILSWPQTHAQWNRPGYMLYGNQPDNSYANNSPLLPAMQMISEIISIHNLGPGEGVGYGHNWVAQQTSRIATVAIGYADGYPRHAANGTPVLVNGKRASLVGRVSMDMLSIDISAIKNVHVGDSVELWGENLSINEVAEAAGTIGYEILGGLSGRAPLVYMS